MSIRRIGSMLAMLLLATVTTGCATSRGVIELSAPQTTATAASTGKKVYINSVVDNRKFEVEPSQPSVPSLDPSEEGGREIEKRALARKRNGYGAALGDILLPEGQSVEALVSSTVKQAFTESGYQVVDSADAINGDGYIVDVSINKFWSWMNPGFWAITLSSEINTEIKLNDKDSERKEVVGVNYADDFAAASTDEWTEVMQKALASYLEAAKERL